MIRSMSLLKITQMIEKEIQSGAPNLFWGKTLTDNCKHEIEESNVFNNCLTGITVKFSDKDEDSEIDFKSKEYSNDIEENQNPSKDIERDFDVLKKEVTFYDDLDETDYFDSEDEYWDSLKNKNIEDNPSPCLHCLTYHLPRSIQEYKECYYEEVFDLSPWCTPAIQKFAKDNDFEIKDVYGDGNCLFRAVADQFMINGCPGHTEVSLRETAIEHLEKCPSKFGVHVSSFLFGETWEEYLQRMKKSGEWGDHMILQALADVYLLHISIYNFVHTETRCTNITSEQAHLVTIKFHIDLGHLGESHYFSLRPSQWLTKMPYRAQIYRMLVTNSETKALDSKFISMSRGHFPESHLAESVQYVLQYISIQEERKGLQHPDIKPIFISNNGKDLQQEETEDSQRKLIEDQFYIDPLSGILLYHLTFIMKHLFPYNMFCKELEINGPIFCTENVWYHILGSQTDESLVTLRDITRPRVMREKKKSGNRWVVVMKSETEAIFPNASMTHRHILGQLLVECCNTHPGYCRLRLVSPSLPDSGEGNDQFGSDMYQKAFSVTNDLRSKIKSFKRYEIYCIGVQCLTYPFNNRWKESRKGFDFPSRFLVSSIIKTGCTLIPKSHPKSTSPEIEWQFDFSMAEHLIFKNLTQAQIHGFRIIKVLVENLVNHLPLKTKHIKSVFLMTCEEMASSDWETNFSGCILYVLDYLLSCLKTRFLPSYFIPENNLIDCHREDDISTMCTLMEYIRLFPTNAIQIVVEKYGYTYGSNLIKRVLSIAKDFPEEEKSHNGINNLFWPLTIATAKMMAKIGYYGVSLDILEQRYEQSLLLSDTDLTQTSVSFSDLFRLAIVEIRQKASRVLLSRSYHLRMGSNVPEMSPEEKECTLQTNIPWAVDSRIGWLKVPLENKGNLNVIASFLYDYSKLEYWRRNVVLAELAITTAIRCIQETLKNEYIFVKDVKDSALKAEIDDQIKTLKKKLIPYYVHLYSISRIDYYVYPIIHYMEDIEKLCKEFPEIAGLVCEMFSYTRQPEKAAEYADKMTAYCRDKGLQYNPKIFLPID